MSNARSISRRRGTAEQHETFVGANAEITVDTTNKRLVVHDGETEGGFPHATEEYVDDKASLSGLTEEGFVKNISANEFGLKNTRQPQLNVLDQPTTRPVWVDDQDIYTVSQGAILKNGVQVGYPNVTLPNNNLFFKAPNGNLIVYWPTNILRISTDDGDTFSTVIDFESKDGEVGLLGPQSICLDEEADRLYLVDYRTSGGTVNTIYKSDDNGATWDVFKETPISQFRHWHGCMFDPVSETVFFMGGDGEDDAGIYKLNSSKTDIEPVYLNKYDPEFSQPARSIGVCFFADHIVWGSDDMTSPAIYRIKRSQIGDTNISAELIDHIANTGWWTQRAKDDDSAWIICTASQDIAVDVDGAAHLYYVENEGKDVYHIGSEKSPTTTDRFGPVGSERKSGGDEFWLSGTINLGFYGKCSITRGATDLNRINPFSRSSNRRPVTVSQYLTFDDNDPVTIWEYQVGTRPFNPRVKIYEGGSRRIGSSGFCTILFRNATKDTTLFAVVNQRNYRQANNIFGALLYESSDGDIESGDVLQIQLDPNNADAGYGFLTLDLP